MNPSDQASSKADSNRIEGPHALHIMVGTKGQMTKMFPILRELDERGVPYHFIRTGQMGAIIDDMIKSYGLRTPDYVIAPRDTDLGSIPACIFWMIRCFFNGLRWRKKVWGGKKGLVLIHGDTESTLVGACLAKLSGIQVGHVEAGLRSFKLFDPFPEEIIRRFVSVFSDYLFAPGAWAAGNLSKEKRKGEVIDTGANTILDTVRYNLDQLPGARLPKPPYVIAAFHRKENLYVRKRLLRVVECVERIAVRHRIIFILHRNTEHVLRKEGIFQRFEENTNIEFAPYFDHVSFMHVIQHCSFAATDGGSLQEETFFLNKPYLILRDRTERQEGIDETSYLSKLDPERVSWFLDHYNEFTVRGEESLAQPSRVVVDEAIRIVNQLNSAS